MTGSSGEVEHRECSEHLQPRSLQWYKIEVMYGLLKMVVLYKGDS